MATKEETLPTGVLTGSAGGAPDIERLADDADIPEAPVEAGRDAVNRVASVAPDKARTVDEEDQEDALDYLLRSFHEQEPERHDVLLVNVGTPQHPKKVRWVIKSVDGQTIRRIRDEAANTRAARRGGAAAFLAAEAAFNASVRIVIAGTVEPDLKEGAMRAGVAGPDIFLQMALESKQGLIDQLSSEIMSLSGYDENDLTDEADYVRAAGN